MSRTHHATQPLFSARSALFLVAAALVAACSEGPAPVLVVRPGSTPAPVSLTQADPVERPYFHYFGEVQMGEQIEHTFTLDNPSRRSVTIERATPTCGCLAVVLEGVGADGEPLDVRDWRGAANMTVVPPGGRLDVTFHVDTRRVPAANTQRLIAADLMTDDPLQPQVRLEASITVVDTFAAAYSGARLVEFGRVDGTREQRRRLVISQSGPLTEELTGEVLDAPDDWQVDVWEEPGVPGSATRSWTLQIVVPPGSDGPFQGRIELGTANVATGEPTEPRVEVARGVRAGPVFAAPPHVFFRGPTRSVEVRVASRTRVAQAGIARVEVRGDLSVGLDVEVAEGGRITAGGNTWTLTMTLPENGPDLASGTVVVHFAGDLWPPLEIPYSKQP